MSASHRLTQEGLARKLHDQAVVETVPVHVETPTVVLDVIEFEPETTDDWGDKVIEYSDELT